LYDLTTGAIYSTAFPFNDSSSILDTTGYHSVIKYALPIFISFRVLVSSSDTYMVQTTVTVLTYAQSFGPSSSTNDLAIATAYAFPGVLHGMTY
jgi:hypothetical protein